MHSHPVPVLHFISCSDHEALSHDWISIRFISTLAKTRAGLPSAEADSLFAQAHRDTEAI